MASAANGAIMSNKRPFAVGDMAIVYGQPSIITRVGINQIYSKTGNFYFDEITSIRTPRKGTEEARDIVAMLAIQYRKVFIRNLQVAISNDLFVDDGSKYEKEFWRLVKNGTRFRGVIQKKLYDKAKSMLK